MSLVGEIIATQRRATPTQRHAKHGSTLKEKLAFLSGTMDFHKPNGHGSEQIQFFPNIPENIFGNNQREFHQYRMKKNYFRSRRVAFSDATPTLHCNSCVKTQRHATPQRRGKEKLAFLSGTMDFHEPNGSEKIQQFPTGEYSCRCHGKRVISAPSKPLKLKLAGHIL